MIRAIYGAQMRILAFFALSLGLTISVAAAPVTLVCSGSLTLENNPPAKIDRETAILDIERRTFRPPMYPSEFPLIRIEESIVSFGSELPNVSTWGSLDRVSGTLAMNTMKPSERKTLKAGGTAKSLAWMTAKCVPAQRMF